MFYNVHTHLHTPPALYYRTLLTAIQVHTENRLYGHLELLILRYVRELRIKKREIESAIVAVLNHILLYRIPFKSKGVQIELQIFLLTLAQKRIFTFSLLKHLGYLTASIRLNRRLTRDNTIYNKFINKRIYLCIFKRNGYILSREKTHTQDTPYHCKIKLFHFICQ